MKKKALMALFSAVTTATAGAGTIGTITNESASRSAQSHEQKNSKDATQTINVNALILEEYVRRFESHEPRNTLKGLPLPAPSARDQAAWAKIVSAPLTNFPAGSFLLNRPGMELGRSGTAILYAAGYQEALDAASSYGGKFNQSTPLASTDWYHVHAYLSAIAFAHYTMTAVAENLERNGIPTGADPAAAVRKAFDEETTLRPIMAANALLSRTASCQSPLAVPQVLSGEVTGNRVELRCGPIQFNAETHEAKIDGRPTLSNDFINGRRIEVAVNNSNSSTSTTEESKSHGKATSREGK